MSEIRRSNKKFIKHYSSAHNILLVGEGDFSFSACLGQTFGSASNIVATSLDSYDELVNKYKNAKANLETLKALGASLLHGVDATQMMTRPDLHSQKFHRIIYNFPHAGFFGREDDPLVIMMHKHLVRGFLWNASSMLRVDGEIHISHKITAPFDRWRIEDLAAECSLLCMGQDVFRMKDYPGYNNKRGSGSAADQPFPLGVCRTFKFKLYPAAEQNLITRQMFSTPLIGMQQTPVSPFTPQIFPAPCIGAQHQQQLPMSPFAVPDVNLCNGLVPQHNYTSECHMIFGGYLYHVEETFGDTSYDVRRSVEEALRLGFEMYMGAAPGRPSSGYIDILEELHHLSISRSERLRLMLLLNDLKL